MKEEIQDPFTGEIFYRQLVEERPYSPNVNHDPKNPRYRRRAEALDDQGREIPDPRPIQPPLGYKRQPSIFELQRDQIALHHRLYAEDREFETFEESEDFDVQDDYDPTSPWENDHDPSYADIKAAIQEVSDKSAAKQPSTPASPSAAAPAAASAPPPPTVPGGGCTG